MADKQEGKGDGCTLLTDPRINRRSDFYIVFYHLYNQDGVE